MTSGTFSRSFSRILNLRGHRIQLGTSPTLKDCRLNLKKAFDLAGISEPGSSADLILACAIGRKSLQGAPMSTRLSVDILDRVSKMAEQRKRHVPVQYILGDWDFCGRTFFVRRPVFIPRPETEELVTLALRDETVQRARNFIEVGCGSGVISVTLLACLPSARCTAIDTSDDACRLTLHNAAKHGVKNRLTVRHATWEEYVTEQSVRRREERFDFLISNPPYVPECDMGSLQPEIERYEDRRALYGGPDGLSVVREILCIAPRVLNDSASIWLEVDATHPAMLREMIKANEFADLEDIKAFKDFMNKERFCQIVTKRRN